MQIKRIVLPLLAALLSGVLPARTVLAANAGDLDTSFNASTDGYVNAVVIQGDGKIVIGGSFANVNGVAQANLARLNADGSLDTTFSATAGKEVEAMALQSDGKLLLAGSFYYVDNEPCASVARLNADGSFDTTFAAYFYGGIYKIISLSNGQSLIAGHENETADFISRLNADGSEDTTFFSLVFSYFVPFGPDIAAGPSVSSRVVAVRHRKAPEPPPPPQQYFPIPVDAVAVQPDGKILYSAGSAISRANADGTADNSFLSADWTAYSGFKSILVQSDGQIVAGGPQANTTPTTSGVVRMNATDGSPDAGFQVATCLGTISDIIEQPDGKLLVSGNFDELDNLSWPHVARLNADGTPDPAFASSTTTVDGNVSTMALQADGNLIVAGNFVRINGVAHQGIARLYGAAAAVPQITSTAGAAGQVGVPFSYQITADGGATGFAANAVYSIYSGLDKPLPAGLSLNPASGVISGTPTREGDYVVALEASNAAGSSVVQIPLTIATAAAEVHPSFFTGEEPLSNGVYYLKFFYSGSQPTSYFSYYAYLSDPNYLYHFDLGYEYVFDANDGHNGIYLYDFASSDFFYTSPTFPFPYLFDFGLNSTIYYYGDPADPERYNTNGVRYFYVFSTGQTITK